MNIQGWNFTKASITGPIRWFASDAQPFLYMAETVPLSTTKTYEYKTTLNLVPGVLPPPGGGQTASSTETDPLTTSGGFAIPQTLPPTPRWDLATIDTGALMVAESFGGAATQLLLQPVGGEVSALTQPGDLESYRGPRFARQTGTSAGTLVTAITDQNQWLSWDRTSEKVSKLGDAQGGLVIQDQSGFAQFRNSYLDSAMSALGENPGELSVELTSQLGATSSGGTTILGDSLVYDFDAVSADSEYVILAATNLGPAIASYNPLNQEVTPVPWPETGYPPSGTLAWSPSLVAVADGDTVTVYFAFVEYVNKEATGIRAGTLGSLSPSPAPST